MIEVVCLNPAMDRTLCVSELQIGAVNRCECVAARPGGKGLNVARFLKTLDPGGSVRVVGFAGGDIGQYIVEGCREYGIVEGFVRIADATRVCVIIVESERVTVVNEDGPVVTAEELDCLRRSLSAQPQLALIAGSAPAGVPESFYAELIRAYKSRSVPVFVDASGRLLAEAIQAGPTLVKVNEHELAQLTDADQSLDLEEIIVQAARLFAFGTSAVIVTLGAKGSLVVTRQEALVLDALPVTAQNTVACGDAYFAGLGLGIARGLPIVEAAAYGTAAAALKAESVAPSIARPERFATYCERVVVRQYSNR
ncbi:MAG: 1-phosphofructokinase family hexose kinase [Bacilli bacterium]